jgi:UDP-N-acetyl-D-galactosamine dehydrogenase
VQKEYQLSLIQTSELNIENYNAVVLAVAHDEFKNIEIALNKQQLVYDIKSVLTNADATL